MSDMHEQSEIERRISEAVALAQSIVEENNKNSDKSVPEADEISHTDSKTGTLNRHGAVWKVIFTISIIVAVVCICFIVRYVRGHNRSLRAENRLRTFVEKESDGTDDLNGSGDKNKTKKNEWYPELDVNFAGLKSQNSDICAWIYIPGTDVDYPVLQGRDNAYYLDHDAYGEYSPDGSIFIDSGSNSDFGDFDTIIYGHNMSTGTMFKTLHNYEEDAFWENNRNVYIYLPKRVIRYEVFAAYRTNDRHILTYNDFSDKEVRKKYIQNIKSKKFDEGIVKNDQNIDMDSRLLTLSTCCGMDGKRWLVQAVKIDEIQIKKEQANR